MGSERVGLFGFWWGELIINVQKDRNLCELLKLYLFAFSSKAKKEKNLKD